MLKSAEIGIAVDILIEKNYTLFRKGGAKMFIDVHAHLIDEKYDSTKNVILRAKEFGVDRIFCAATDLVDSKQAVEVAEKYEGVYACVGLYPEYAEQYNEALENEFINLARSKKVVALGEIGLDYHGENPNKGLQKEVFEKQINLAYRLNLPIIIHSRDAMEDTISILKKNKYKLKGGVFHCYSGSVEEAKEIVKLGFSFSFGGVCTFKNARRAVEVIEQMPIENILLETDCPYLAPVPHRGEVNEPKNIPIIAEKIALIKNMKLEEVAEVTTKNVERIFKI